MICPAKNQRGNNQPVMPNATEIANIQQELRKNLEMCQALENVSITASSIVPNIQGNPQLRSPQDRAGRPIRAKKAFRRPLSWKRIVSIISSNTTPRTHKETTKPKVIPVYQEYAIAADKANEKKNATFNLFKIYLVNLVRCCKTFMLL